jgi:hypothetical protein
VWEETDRECCLSSACIRQHKEGPNWYQEKKLYKSSCRRMCLYTYLLNTVSSMSFLKSKLLKFREKRRITQTKI